MKCPTCGNELGAQALFCGKCGTPVTTEESDDQALGALKTRSISTQRRGRADHAATSETAGNTASSRASFRGAMDTSHKKARRKMPVLVLMALFMFAFTSLAWALYTIIHPTVANEREIDWTPETVYEAMDPDRFDLELILEEANDIEKMPSVRVSIPESIAIMEGDQLSFVLKENSDMTVIIYYRVPDGGIRAEVRTIPKSANR